MLARRIGVRAQFGEASLTSSTASGRIGIRPQICYAAPEFGAEAKAGQLWSGDFRDAHWPLPGGLRTAQQAVATAELSFTQSGFHTDFCRAHAVADLGSDPNSVRDLEICQRRSPELGSDPVSYTHLTLPTNREV